MLANRLACRRRLQLVTVGGMMEPQSSPILESTTVMPRHAILPTFLVAWAILVNKDGLPAVPFRTDVW
jgi:hypothetical protein